MTTGCLAVLIAQPTDVVKVRFQAQLRGSSNNRYSNTLQAYAKIAREEGAKGLWKGMLVVVGHFPFVRDHIRFSPSVD